MTFYCTRCGTGVEAEFGWTAITADESVREAFCPNCGRRLHLECVPCPICGEPMPKYQPACIPCTAEVSVAIQDLVKRIGHGKPDRDTWEGVAGVFDYIYDREIKEGRI